MFAGFAIRPILVPTWLRARRAAPPGPSSPPFSVTNATIAWPVCASIRPQNRLGHRGVVDEGALDLDRRDPMAGDVHHVVHPAEEPVAVLVDPCAVAREVHAVVARPVGLDVALVVAVDPAQHRRPRLAQDQVAPPPGPTSRPCSSNTAASTPGKGLVADPGFVVVSPGSGVIRIIPVSVCHQVSTTGVLPPPTCSRYHIHASGLIGSPTDPSSRSDEVVLPGVLRPPRMCARITIGARCRGS